MKNKILVVALALAAAGCASTDQRPTTVSGSSSTMPAAIAVPAGNRAALTLVGAGDLTYECRAKADGSGHEWVFAGPNAVLYDKDRKVAGKYYGGPTWEASDGSKITGKQLAVSPGPAGAIPLQLVQTTPATGTGAMTGVTYIQRVNTQGGVAPKDACAMGNMGAKQTVKYQADYVFYKAN